MADIEIVLGYPYNKEIQSLIKEYGKELGRDLNFQHFDDELAHLNDKYRQPDGLLLAAKYHDQIIGCVAYYRFDAHRCEMKRLYVKEEYRSMHCGRMLVETLIEQAKKSGYKEMLLDTIIPLQHAIALYTSLGFQITNAYYDNPMEDVIYMHRCFS